MTSRSLFSAELRPLFLFKRLEKREELHKSLIAGQSDSYCVETIFPVRTSPQTRPAAVLRKNPPTKQPAVLKQKRNVNKEFTDGRGRETDWTFYYLPCNYRNELEPDL